MEILKQKMMLFLITIICLSNYTLLAQTTEQLQKTSDDFTEVAKEAIPAVVSIQVKSPSKARSFSWYGGDDDEQDNPFDFFGDELFGRFFGIPRKEGTTKAPQISQGSGFIVSPDGYILTNNHVVRDHGTMTVILNDGREFPGKIIGEDQATDLALVKIDADHLPYLKLGNSSDLKIGQWVVAIGNTLSLGGASLTVGVVSAKGRSNLDLARIEDFIQTDAAINRGNSGGPLLNLKGDVVGINTAIATNMANGYMGIGFAIPSNIAKHVLSQLKETGTVTRGYLGIILQNVDNDLAQAFDLKKVEGALVAEVAKDSPAEKAGIKQGDIILKYNQEPVENIGFLRNSVALEKPGERISLTILRDKKMLNIPVQIGLMPEGKVDLKEEVPQTKFGFEVKTLTPELSKSLGLSENESGVVVTKVDPNSAAGLAGIKKGAIVLSINQQKVSTSEDFHKELKNAPTGKPILFLIKQGSTIRFISLRVE